MRTSFHTGVVVAGVIVVCAATGCLRARSISNADYGYGGYWGGADRYQGELSEFSLLGIDPGQTVNDADIVNEYAKPKLTRMAPGSSVLLIQSGAQFPDEPMQRLMAEHFTVGPFSGVPVAKPEEGQPAGLSKALRLAAAQGGYDYIAVHWGVLEAQQKNLGTRAVSWVPLIGYRVPDQTQNMRIRLKMIVLDARTGQWAMLVPEPVEADALSARASREQSDQGQIAELKEKAYAALVEQLVENFVQEK